jgi:hypothetical protein
MIWFMAPDLAEASGGIKMMYRMVDALRLVGHDATIWHGQEGHRYDEFRSSAPVHHGLTADLAPGDVLVMHEVGGPRWSFLPGDLPVVMLCQGWVFVLQGVGADDELGPGYPGWPQVCAVLATSAYIERYVVALSGRDLPVYRVPVLIDDATFRPLPKRRIIAYMPRRRGAEMAAAIQLLRRADRLPGWEFRAIDGLAEDEVAAALGEAAIYLSGAEREGFGLPAAEAMASGCVVVGFTGDGGTEFMDPSYCTVVHDADVLGLADGVAEAAHLFDDDRPVWQAGADAGRGVVLSRYGRDAMTSALESAFGEICAPGSTAVVQSGATVRHYQAYAPRTGWHHEAYRWARHRARVALDAWPQRRRADR